MSLCYHESVNFSTYLEVALHVEEQVLRLNVTMGDTLTVEVGNASQDLLEAALDLAWRHATTFNGRIQITAGAELHHLAPMLSLILDQIDSLHDVDMMQCGRYAELGGELLDILFLCFILSPLPKLLEKSNSD